MGEGVVEIWPRMEQHEEKFQATRKHGNSDNFRVCRILDFETE